MIRIWLWVLPILLCLFTDTARGGDIRYLVERSGEKHRCIAPTTGTTPAHIQARPADVTGIPIRRITEINDFPWARKWDGNPFLGLTNGYSKFSCVNATGEYALAYGTQSGISALIRLSDGAFMGWPKIRLPDRRFNGIGESSAPRWDLSGRPGTALRLIADGLFGSQDFIVDIDPLTNVQQDIVRGKYQVNMDPHGDQSARWRPFSNGNKRICLLDLETNEIHETSLPAGGHDMSPTGAWLLYYREPPHRFYRTADLLAGTTDTFVEVPTLSHGHDGWAFDRDGSEVFVAMDNKTDWYFAFNPETKKRTDIIHMSELGWKTNYHLARMINPAKKGWMLMATYSTEDAAVSWAANQIMMIEIRPAAERPRIWRLGPTYMRYRGQKKSEEYFTEAFASIDPAGNGVYWGSNWLGTDNLELYRMELPNDWEKHLSEE
ncbi:hypothetical protein LLG95_12270 [bacterium]|nr:hypothetical protein [bacterium]